MAEEENRAQFDENLRALMSYQDDWATEMNRRRHLGIETVLLPHPSQLVMDENTAVVRLIGPFDEEEKQRWDKYQNLKAIYDENIAVITQLLKNPAEVEREDLLEELRSVSASERRLKRFSARSTGASHLSIASCHNVLHPVPKAQGLSIKCNGNKFGLLLVRAAVTSLLLSLSVPALFMAGTGVGAGFNCWRPGGHFP